MQNPSQGLQAPLQNHVHLISAHRFPVIASLDLNQALTYLLDAPTIVKSVAAMSWTYVQAPQDGTIWLEWLPPDKGDGRFPSDGYVWADTEATYRHDFRGYTIQMMKHTIGYRMNYDQMASHARTRFHIIAKNPSVNAAPPDPALWIVHYHQAEHGRILPSSQVPFPPQMQLIMQERKWLESQGKLERRDFMLHDRQSWPQITVPTSAGLRGQGMQQQGMYGHPAQQATRFPPYFPQQAGQQPPAKRQRPNPPVAGGSTEALHDSSIEEEENTTHGDFFDHLTPRDISMTRYMQHHHWMEEVFSSPYASNRLVATDLGMGLMGELKGLTDGILDPPSPETIKPPKPREAQPFTNLSKVQLEEFDKRVAKHLQESQAQIERMKADHAKQMQEWKKTQTLMQAEKRLRHATWEGHESSVPTFRFEEVGVSGHIEEGAKKEKVEDVVKEVEELLGVKVSSRKEADLVEKGGLEREEDQSREQAVPESRLEHQRGFLGQQPVTNTGVDEPTMYHHDPASMTVQSQAYGSNTPQPAMQPQQQLQAPAKPTSAAALRASSGDLPVGIDNTDMQDTSMVDGMGMGVDDSNIDFGDSQVDLGDTGHEDAAAISASGSTLAAPGQTTSTTQAPPSHVFAGGSTEQQQPATGAEAALGDESALGDSGVAEGTGLGDDSMFNDNMFGDLTNTDDAGGEGDFDFGAAGMDDSAFGDATYGMETGGTEGGVSGTPQGGH